MVSLIIAFAAPASLAYKKFISVADEINEELIIFNDPGSGRYLNNEVLGILASFISLSPLLSGSSNKLFLSPELTQIIKMSTYPEDDAASSSAVTAAGCGFARRQLHKRSIALSSFSGLKIGDLSIDNHFDGLVAVATIRVMVIRVRF
jgi:hypothetical protein